MDAEKIKESMDGFMITTKDNTLYDGVFYNTRNEAEEATNTLMAGEEGLKVSKVRLLMTDSGYEVYHKEECVCPKELLNKILEKWEFITGKEKVDKLELTPDDVIKDEP